MSVALAPLEGKYEIVAKIKEGGMGAIYKVRHRLLEEIRVVKVLRREFEDDADLHERFIQEARSAIRLRHPNVVQIFDFLLEGGMGYIVMEYIDGVDLGEWIRRGQRVSLPLFLEIAAQGLRALGYLHQKGFVHRDISPDNLMLCCDFAGRPLVKMIDLGIAKRVEGGAELTASGMFLGKFRYSSPEHFGSQGPGGVEPRSDLYSMGVVLYEFLTGHYPIRGDEPPQLIAGHLFHPPLDFEETDAGDRVPPDLRKVLTRVLDKDPRRRFPTAADFSAALQALQERFPPTEETAEEARKARNLRTEEQSAKVGSTQNRLDRGFVHPTPAPSAETALVAPPEVERKISQEQVAALLAGAETLHRLGQPEAARAQLMTILRLAPQNARARELLEEIDAVHKSSSDSAQEKTVLFDQTGKGREEQLFDHHLQSACTLIDAGSYAEAVEHFEAALRLQPGNLAVENMLSEARGSLEEERKARQARLRGEVGQLRQLLESGQLETARARLVSARRAYGDEESLLVVQREVEEAETRYEHSEILEILREVTELREAGELTQAVQTLERARRAWQGSALAAAGGTDVVTHLEREEKCLEEAHRRLAELDEAIFLVESAIEKGSLVEADRILFQAQESFGSLTAIRELRDRLDHLHHQSLEAGVRKLIDRATRSAEAGDFKEARGALDKARVLAPRRSEIRAEIEESEKSVALIREKLRVQQSVRLMSTIEELIESRNLEQAQARLAAAEVDLGTLRPEEAAAFKSFRQRIADGYQERVNSLIREAGVAIEAKRYRAAIPFLEQALELSPGDAWLADRLEQARSALARPADAGTAADAVEGLLESGDLDEASARLAVAVERWGKSPELEGLEQKLEARLLERR